ncbi:hypothetical protein NFI96_031955, partial [Prochilodus magdalenae]
IGLHGSCLVIPCSFNFKTTRPSKVRVRWYEHSKERSKDLLIFDEDDSSAASKMWGKTELYGSSSEGNCSLKINSLILQHDEEKLFPWMDQNTVESFHKENYDSFVQLHVTEQADKPEISILGVPRVEEQITVSCRAHHTCPSSPPKLSMAGAQQTATHAPMHDGFWVTTIQHSFSVKEDEQTVTCKASFPGGQTSEAQINLNAQCIHKDMLIDPEVADVTEGVAMNFTCKVIHACRKEVPTISWNYEEMPETVVTKPNRGSGWITQSNVLFLASMEDHGKKLICTAKFPYGEFTASVVLHVQKFVPKIVDPFENDKKGTDKYRFNHSCVFIVMRATPDKPVISDLPEELEPGKKYTITCSVTHTCPSHPPSITWSIPTKKVWVSHMETRAGQWKNNLHSHLHNQPLTNQKKTSPHASPARPRYEGLKMETIGPYILAPLFSILLLCGIAVAAVVVYKKRARR